MFQLFESTDHSCFLCKTRLYVPDKPGILAKIAEIFAKHSINITYFYYNRSEHPNKIIIEGVNSKKESFKKLYKDLSKENLWTEFYEEDFQITDIKNILKVSAYLENKPGTLAEFARLLKKYEVNVLYMIYNELVSENKAEIALYVKDHSIINKLAQELNLAGYHYNFEYSGTDQENTNKVIGLNLIERFFLRLKKVLDPEEIKEIKNIIQASKNLSETLVNFNKELGKNLEAGQVFTNILVFAFSSRSKTGKNFFYKKLPILPAGDLLIHSFRLPTGGNVYLIQKNDEFVMIDGGYGIYYENVKHMLEENGIDPAKIRRIYISHADADHAGLSGYFEEEFGSRVFMHPEAKGIIENNNRAYGTNTPLFLLNKHFTVLVNHFTRCKFPVNWIPFKTRPKEKIGEFQVIDEFQIGDAKFKVIQSLGGHIQGQVFFLSEDAGILYTADYLLYLPSLSKEEKEILSIPKYLLTSTNTNSGIFRKEMNLLKQLAKEIDEKLKKQGRGLMIFPGHGDYYPARIL